MSKNIENNLFYKDGTTIPKSPHIIIDDMLDEKAVERIREYVTFYRKNLNIFIEEYFNLHLHPFQQDMMYKIGVSNNVMIVASRAIGKTWALGVGACAIAVLYPNTEVVIVSSKLSQAGLIISEKIDKELRKSSPNLIREIKNLTNTAQSYQIEFHNGSSVKVVPALESARGERATFIIFEEFRLIPKNIADTVIQPMSHPRQAPYKLMPKYIDIIKPEETRLCYISSSGYTSEWIADAIKTQITEMVNGEDRTIFLFDYFIALQHGLKTITDIQTARKNSDEISFLIEYCNILYGESANAFFALEQMRRAQVIKEPFYPIKNEERKMGNECFSYEERKDNEYGKEIRILTIDIATAGGKNNDNTCIHCISAIPTARGYIRKYVYECVYSGTNPVLQCCYIRRMQKDFNADYVVFDLANNGRSFFGMLTQDIVDPETGEEYQGWTILQDDSIHMVSKDVRDDLRSQVLSSNPIPILYPIKTTAEQNHLIAMDFRKQLNDNKIELLIDENAANDILSKDKFYRESMGDTQRAWLLAPFRNTSEFIMETIQLDATWKGGQVSLSEPSGCTKDRYSSGSYGNYFVTLKERELLKDKTDNYSPENYRKTLCRTSNTNRMRNKYFK